MRYAIRMLAGSSLLATAIGAGAGTVNVSFVNASNYWDAGNASWEEGANLELLAAHLRQLGQRWLPADQELKVDVLQVDLAGGLRPFNGAVPVRVITGGADLPRIQLRYSLQSGGKTIASGEEWVKDLDYTHGLAARGDGEALFYEKRMLATWFKTRFVGAPASPG